MTDPTINGATLSTGGTHSKWHQPQARLSQSSIPQVEGVFVQRFGQGPAICTGRGSITAANLAAIKLAIRTTQGKVNGVPGTYVDGDNANHSDCVLLSYTQVGDMKKNADGSAYWCQVQWVVLKQVA